MSHLQSQSWQVFLANGIHQGIAQIMQKVQNQRVIFIILMIIIADTLTCKQHFYIIVD